MSSVADRKPFVVDPLEDAASRTIYIDPPGGQPMPSFAEFCQSESESKPAPLLNGRWRGVLHYGDTLFDVAVVQEGLDYRPLAWHDGWQFVSPAFGIKVMSAWGAALDLRSMRQTETIDLRVEGAAEIGAASEALNQAATYVRRALCDVLSRLGGDGSCAFMNGDSHEVLADAISRHVLWLEERARDAALKSVAMTTKY